MSQDNLSLKLNKQSIVKGLIEKWTGQSFQVKEKWLSWNMHVLWCVSEH